MSEILNIKPLSVNIAWQGKRFKTIKYKNYEKICLLSLPNIYIPPQPYIVNLEFGFSNVSSDIDNPVKPFLDILQKKYGINDKDIFQLNIKKRIVKKGFEYIKFNITELV